MAYRVLIVDDSPAMRSFIRRVLQLSGLEMSECLEARNGKAALDLLRTEWVDVVLTDINMPEMDGEEFLRVKSADDLLRPIPVIVVSTDATQPRVDRMISLGARGYLSKPFLAEALRSQLEATLGATRA